MLSSSSRLDEFQTRNLPPNARNQWWAPLLLLLRRAAQLPPRRRSLLGVSLRRWARLCPAVNRMERLLVRATAGRPSRRRQTSPTHASMQVRWTRVPYTRPTPLSHPPECSHAPTCTRPNHTHMIVICRRTHPSHHHTPTRTCPGVNGHVDTHGGRLSSSARGIRQPALSSAAPRPYAPCSGWPLLEEV